MKNKEIEKTIYESFNNKKPELFSKILEQCPEMIKTNKTDSRLKLLFSQIFSRRVAYSFASASLVVILALVLFQQFGVVTPQAFSIIAIDVNPSVVLELDEDDKVINITKNNEDAEIIIGDMNLIGIDYNIAINAIIGSMVANGYIDELSNSVLLSIQSNDAVREGQLMTELRQVVNDVLAGNAINGSIITQNLDFEGNAENLAELLDISEAKAELILDIIEADPRVAAEELAQLSINDLNLYLESQNLSLENVQKIGEASELGIITVEEAYHIALTELEIEEVAVLKLKVELEQEDGTMVYKIKIKVVDEEYKILISAKEGSVFIKTKDNNDDDHFPIDTLTEEAVLAIVLTTLGINPNLISELEIEEEVDNSIAYYEIEFEYNGLKYKLESDALTGDIYTNSMDETGFDHPDDEDNDDDDDDDDDDEPDKDKDKDKDEDEDEDEDE